MTGMLECRDDGDDGDVETLETYILLHSIETLETYILLHSIESLCVWMRIIRIGGVEYKEIMIFCPFKHESEIVE